MRNAVKAAALAAALATTGCDGNPLGPDYDPEIPAAWAAAVTNAHYPLTPGTTFRYEGQTGEGLETTLVEVLTSTRQVNGVAATIVRDRVYLDGELIEDTFDWYAQDAAGNLWYLGEDSKEIENGVVVSTEGSWEWGLDGALPGIIMWADPAAHVGEEYRQEFYEGEAEDWAMVLALGQAVTVPFGVFSNCIKTEDWNGLESGGREYKYYCPGTGLVLETPVSGSERVELVARTPPSGSLSGHDAGWGYFHVWLIASTPTRKWPRSLSARRPRISPRRWQTPRPTAPASPRSRTSAAK